MVKRVHKSSDGLYHVNGGKFKGLIGSRAQVMHGTVYKTRGGLTKNKLKFNKGGKIVSRAKSSSNPLKRLTDAGYRTKKGTFGSFKNGAVVRTRRKSRRKSRGKTAKKRRTKRRTKRRGSRCRTKKGKFRKC
tara:strand:+ start:3277 stop:3672 length:396 start_codon:yes stop_codon:yes gene_type:complete